MASADLLGSIAALFTTMAFVPQVMQCLRTRDLSAISLPMYLIFSLGVFLWLVYGVTINSLPVILANSFTLALSLLILGLKLKTLSRH
jgi:MtN3 and saliva related transmembrane protein